MNTRVARGYRCAAILAIVATISAPAAATVVLQEDFQYANTAALQANWQVGVATARDFDASLDFDQSGGSSGMSTTASQRPASVANQTLMRLNNSATFRTLSQTLTTDFSLVAKVAFNSYSRSLQFGLTDASGNGYSLRWTGANVDQFSGNGHFQIRRVTGWSTATPDGVALASNLNGLSPPTRHNYSSFVAGSPATAIYSNPTFLGYSELRLDWTASTGQLRAYQDGVLLNTATLTDLLYSSFSRVYAGGGTGVHFDSITVTAVPESGAIAALLPVLGGLGVAVRKRFA